MLANKNKTIMDDLMEQIKDLFRLKENQEMNYEQQMARIRLLIQADRNEIKSIFFLRGLSTASLAIEEEKQRFKNQ